jgi:hypothetical protein
MDDTENTSTAEENNYTPVSLSLAVAVITIMRVYQNLPINRGLKEK